MIAYSLCCVSPLRSEFANDRPSKGLGGSRETCAKSHNVGRISTGCPIS
ncbi:hypothetical protein JT359_00750 [Candidatus Poribacteria bacterium]|nr:hypothetical protein [Candidatus Poribacteria bacterium]